MTDAIRRHGPSEPSPWVERWLFGVRTGGQVLDIACGRGRHLRLALARGLRATGIDRDLSALSELRGAEDIELVEADLEEGAPFPLAGRRFDGIVVTNYLFRPLFPAILDAVAPAGLLIYETFALGNEALGSGPSNPDFLLSPNELVTTVAPRLTVIAYEHGRVTCRGERIAQRIVAVGPDHPWIETPARLDELPANA